MNLPIRKKGLLVKPAAPSSFLRVYDISIIALLNLIIQIPADDVAVYIRIAFHVIFWP